MLSVCSRTRHGFFSASSPRMAASNSIRLLVVSGSPPESSRSLSPMRSSTPQPPGPGLPRHAPSVNISTSGSPVRDELARQLEDHSFGAVVRHFLGDVEARTQRVDDLPDEDFGRGGSGGNANGSRLAEPLPVDIRRAFDQARRNAEALGYLGEAKRIAAVRRADHEQPIALAGD